MFVRISIALIGYLLNTFIDEIELWCHWPAAFRGSWLMNTLKSIIVGFFLEFILVWLHPIYNAHIFALVPCLCISFDTMVLEESYEALIINVMKEMFWIFLIQLFLQVWNVIWIQYSINNLPAGTKISVSFMKGGLVMEKKLIYFLFWNILSY